MAEWLRRLTRNQLGSARVGSNPTGVDLFFGHLRGSIPTGVDNFGNFQHFLLHSAYNGEVSVRVRLGLTKWSYSLKG